MTLISFLETSIRTTFCMAVRSPSARDVILLPASVTLTSAGRVERSPVGTFVNVLLVKSIESTKAAAADETLDVRKVRIASSPLLEATHFRDRCAGFREDNPHVHGRMDDGFGHRKMMEENGVVSAQVPPVMNCFTVELDSMNQAIDPHPAVTLQSNGSTSGIVKY